MDAITLLKGQHREVEALFEKYDAARSLVTKQTIFDQIADNLAAHSAIEEKLMYPAVYIGALKDDLKEAVEEHLAIKRLIADLMAMSPVESNFDAKIKVLSEQVEHHVGEEEGPDGIFASIRKLMPKREIDALGDAMEQMFDALMEGEPRSAVPGETDQAAPLR